MSALVSAARPDGWAPKAGPTSLTRLSIGGIRSLFVGQFRRARDPRVARGSLKAGSLLHERRIGDILVVMIYSVIAMVVAGLTEGRLADADILVTCYVTCQL